MPSIVDPKNLGSGPTPDRPARLPLSEAKAFQESLEAEGQAVLRAYCEHRNIRHLVSTLLVVLDNAGAAVGQDPTRADLNVTWMKDGVLLIQPIWSVIQDRLEPIRIPDQVIEALLAAPKIRTAVATLLHDLVAYCRSRSVPLGSVSFDIGERPNGMIGVALYDQYHNRMGHDGSNVAWEIR